MRLTYAAPVVTALCLLGAPPRARAEDSTAPSPAAPSNGIAWHASVAEAFAAGLKEKKPIFIAINAGRVDGGQAEPAGKMLREDVYPSAAIVEKSRAFSCALVTAEGNGADYGELRQRFGIDGQIVSPQHLLAYSDGSLIERREYWSVRGTTASIDALGAMLDAALASERNRAGLPPVAPTPPAAPGMDAAPGMEPAAPGDPVVPAQPAVDPVRKAWIETNLARIQQAGNDKVGRDAAVREMVRGDQKYDCLEPLCALFVASKKEPEIQISIVRGFGRPGLEYAVPTVMTALDDKNDELRSNAAVTLEYIGSPRAVEALTKRLPREEIFANVCRALGRCGAKMDAVRKTLVKELGSAKSDKALAGPVIGLAYFEKDADVARALEKQAKKEERFRRAVLLWALMEVNDPKSADFLRKEIIPSEKFGPALLYDNNVLKALEGDAEARNGVLGGMGYVAGLIGGIGDAARKGREGSGFEPKGEFGGGGPGGGRGPGGGMPGMGG